MRIAVVFACFMVFVFLAKGRKVLQPLVNVFDQSGFVVVHINAGSNVHRGNEDHAFAHAALADDLLHLRRDVYIGPVRLGVKFKVFRERLHQMNFNES